MGLETSFKTETKSRDSITGKNLVLEDKKNESILPNKRCNNGKMKVLLSFKIALNQLCVTTKKASINMNS